MRSTLRHGRHRHRVAGGALRPTVVRAPEWAEMHDRAGVDYDVLLLGYVNRFARSVEAFVDAKRAMHPPVR